MGTEEQEKMQQRLDEALLGFRVAQKAEGATEGWLRAIRQAAGFSVDEVARRLGVSRREIFRLEKAEKESRIQLGSLRQAAGALDCELVYALAPRKGTLRDLADTQKAALKQADFGLREKRWQGKAPESLGWRKVFRKALRRMMRKAGIRVR